MKKIFLAFCFLCFAQGFSQIAGTDDKEIMKNLCRKWKVEYATLNGQRLTLEKQTPDGSFVFFFADNTYTLGETKDFEGNWSFDSEARTVTTIMNGVEAGTITTLNANEMIITYIAGDASNPRKLESHYVVVK